MSSASEDQLALVRSLKREREALALENRSLKHGGGDGTSSGMDSVDAKIAAAEARTDTKFTELRGDLKAFATKNTVWGAAGSLFLGVLAVLAFAGDRFDAGIGQADTRQAQLERDQRQDAKLDEILKRLPRTRIVPGRE